MISFYFESHYRIKSKTHYNNFIIPVCVIIHYEASINNVDEEWGEGSYLNVKLI